MVVPDHPVNVDKIMNMAVFRVADTACFLWHNMDDAHIIYDTRSGYSQAMNGFAREIFAIIEECPRSLPDILVELQEILEHSLESDLIEQVQRTVAEFDKMGLIEPVIP